MRKLLVMFFVGIFLVVLLAFPASSYERSNINYLYGGGSLTGFTEQPLRECDDTGQDFAVQVSPLGCTPAVVRTDLLEEQDVPVFCQISATQMNPLIDVKAIDWITLADWPQEVRNVAFMPNRNAINSEIGKLNQPFLNSLGYVVIVLKQQRNASQMPDWVEGTMTANLQYDVENAFGLGRQYFFLPEMNENEWEDNYLRYSFWEGKGFLRAENIQDNSARITLYNGVNKLQSFNLDVGETSSTYYMPGFDCLAGVDFKLDGLEDPDTRARLNVNGNILEVKEDEEFLEGKCHVSSVEKNGILEAVKGYCRTDDEGTEAFDLSITPKVNLTICGENGGCKTDLYSVGDVLYDDFITGDDRKVYLGYIGEREDGRTYVVPVASPAQSPREFEKSFNFKLLKIYGSFISSETNSKIFLVDLISTIMKKSYGTVLGLASEVVTGSDYGEWIDEGQKKEVNFFSIASVGKLGDVAKYVTSFGSYKPKEFTKKTITFNGFGGMFNHPLDENTQKYYEKALTDYDYLIETFPGAVYNQPQNIETKGEQALIAKIKLADYLQQEDDLMVYCEEYKKAYPDSDYINVLYNNGKGICDDMIKMSSDGNDVVEFLIGGNMEEILLEGVYEPSLEEYSVDIIVDGKPYNLRKGEKAYLSLDEGEIVYETNAKRSKEEVVAAIKDIWGDNSQCLNYVDDVLEAGSKYGIDPLLLFALMKQESSCNPSASSGADSYGLMQVHSWEMCAKDTSLNIKSFDDVKGASKTNIRKNILCGAYILKQKYSDETKLYECDTYQFPLEHYRTLEVERAISKEYTGWDYALRMYNGWSCAGPNSAGKIIDADQSFVEDVRGNYTALGGAYSDMEVNKKLVSDSPEYITLDRLEPGYAVFDVSRIAKEGVFGDSLRVDLNGFEIVGKNKYKISVEKINLKRLAKVDIIPRINYERSESEFSFKIGIEKRGIDLSPDQIKKKIDTLNDSINDWGDKSSKLGDIVKGLKGACTATQLILTLKNFVGNTGGKAIARQEVMRGTGGWYDRCAEKVQLKEYASVEKCLSDNAGPIEDDVNKYYEQLKAQNERIKVLQDKNLVESTFGTKIVNSTSFGEDFAAQVRSNVGDCLKSRYGNSVKIGADTIEINNFISRLQYENVPIEDLRDLELHACMEGDESLDAIADASLKTEMKTIYENSEKLDALKKAQSNAEGAGLKDVPYMYLRTKDTREIGYDGYQAQSNLGGISNRDFVQGVVSSYDNKPYLIKLEPIKGSDGEFRVVGVYTEEGVEVTGTSASFAKDLVFKKYDSSTYRNPFKYSRGESSPKLRYYETEPYKGLPAIVPFDLKDGWYVSIKQTLPVGAQIASYDDSARVNSFYLCNVGEDGVEDNRGGDDICQMINAGTGQPYNQFTGLKSGEAESLIRDAFSAVEQASKAYGKGKTVTIRTSRGTYTFEVGSPAVDIPNMQCYDFMSATDCRILFNVCDPVVCPSSRCDLGGAYPVRDVVQTGVIGSLVLCLPNFPQVYVPVCLTGVKAGIDGWLSVQKSYRDCLQTSLETGETVGVCDELHSIYMCEFFWRNGLPLAKFGFEKLLEVSTGQSSRGGGEYLGVKSAIDAADSSMDYFTQYYASNSEAAFSARATESSGTEVCKVALSNVLPMGSANLDALTEPESPPQYHGRFEEIPYTTATNPPASHYKVYYHIYAGENYGAYYRVYLKGSAQSSYYEDTAMSYQVDSDYIPAGEYASETVDFTAPSGYKEMCIVVNDQEECGFQEVSTDFAVNYIKDSYVAQQASQKNIKSETDCVSGTPSLYSLANPNLEAGVSGVVSPSVYNYGIVRICATNNPGLGTDGNANMNNSRWVDVGYCDDTKMRCWLDTDSVKDAIRNSDIEGDVLEEQNANFQKKLVNSGNYLTDDAQFKEELGKINDTTDKEVILDNINFIHNLIGKVIWEGHKAELYYLEGQEYDKLARLLYDEYLKNRKPTEIPGGKTNETTEQGAECDDLERFCPVGYDCVNGNCVEIVPEEFTGEGLVYDYYDGNHAKVFYKDKEWYFTVDGEAGNVNTVYAYINSNRESYSDAVPPDVTSYTIPDVLVFGKLSESSQEFVLGMEDMTYEEGYNYLLESTLGHSGSTLSTGVVVMDSKGMFRVSFPDATSLYFGYDPTWDGWGWSPDGTTWINAPNTEVTEGRFAGRKPVAENIKIITALEPPTDFYEGAAIIFKAGSEESSSETLGANKDKLIEEYGEDVYNDIKSDDECSDCGDGTFDVCTEKDCNALGLLLGKNCEFEKKWYKIGGWTEAGGVCSEKS